MAMKQTDPAGFDVIREHYRQISSTVDPTILAGCMFEANLIEFDLLNDSGREDRSPASRVQALINALLGNGDEGVFQNFVQKLCEEKLWQELGGTLRDAYVKKGGQWKEDGKGQGVRAGGGGGGAKPLEQSGVPPVVPEVPSSPLRATPTNDPCQWCTLEQIFSHGCHAPAKGETPMGKRGNQCKSSTPHWVGGTDMAGITQGFGFLKTALRECVEKMTSVEGLKAAVRGISGAPLHNVAMYGDHAHAIQRCSTHAEVLEIVNMYASWAGHEVMPHLLQSVGGEARREREAFNAELQGFRKRLTEYRRLRLWECPPLVTGHTLPSGGRYLLVKPVGQADPTLFALEQFHQRLVKSLNLPLYALRMCTVCAACGGVVYCVPRGVYREVFKVPLSLEQMREASVMNIVELTSVGGDPPATVTSQATPLAPPSPSLTSRDGSDTPSRCSEEETEGVCPDTLLTSQAKKQCVLICHTLWGPQLSYNTYQIRDPLVRFESLWPDLQRMISIYQDAHLVDCAYELCKLLLASGSYRCLEGMVERRVLREEEVFKEAGTVTLGHLMRALSPHSSVKENGNGTKGRRPSGIPISTSVRDEIFLHATQPEMFYTLVMELQNNSFDVNSEKNSNGDLLVHVAVRQGLVSLPLMFVLVHMYKANIDARNTKGHTPLCLAAQLGDENMIEVMVCVFGADVNAFDVEHLRTPLHFAARHNHPGVVSILLRRGADSGCEDRSQCDPAILARKHHMLECAQVLDSYKTERARRLSEEAKNGTLNVYHLNTSDLCLVNADGMTLLMVAVVHNQVDLMRQLIAKTPCPLNYKQIKMFDLSNSVGAARLFTESGHTFKTAVCLAAEMGHVECLAALIRAGAHPAIRDNQCWLPLHYAIWNGHVECVEQILNCPTPQQGLVGLQAAIGLAENSRNDKVLGILQEALERRQKLIVQPLLFETAVRGNKDKLMEVLESGDNVNPLNRNGDWPLLLAAGLGHLEVVKLLHQYGGVVVNYGGSLTTPLHQASRGGHLEVVRYLLGLYISDGEYKARVVDIDARNTHGATPLELAASSGRGDVVRLLIEMGASTTVPGSDGRFVHCAEYSGIQLHIESTRKVQLKRLLKAMRGGKKALEEFKRVWKGPCDFNLHLVSGESLLMMAAQQRYPDVLTFLIQEVKRVQRDMIINNPNMLPSASADDSSFLEGGVSDLGTTPLDTTGDDPNSSLTSLGTRSLRSPQTHQYDTNSIASLGTLQDFGGSMTSLNSMQDDGLGTQRDDLIASMESILDTRPRLSPINSIMGEEEGEGPPPASIQATLIRYQSPRDGQTALHIAITANRSENAHILLSADPRGANIQDKVGNTPLHLACQLGLKRCLRVLLSSPYVDCRIENKEQRVPEQCTSAKYFRRKLEEYRRNHEEEMYNTSDGGHVIHCTNSTLVGPIPRTSSPLLRHTPHQFSMDTLEEEVTKLREEIVKDEPDPSYSMVALDDEVLQLKEELATKRKRAPELNVLDREIDQLKAALQRGSGLPDFVRLDQEMRRLRRELEGPSLVANNDDIVDEIDRSVQQMQQDLARRRNTFT